MDFLVLEIDPKTVNFVRTKHESYLFALGAQGSPHKFKLLVYKLNPHEAKFETHSEHNLSNMSQASIEKGTQTIFWSSLSCTELEYRQQQNSPLLVGHPVARCLVHKQNYKLAQTATVLTFTSQPSKKIDEVNGSKNGSFITEKLVLEIPSNNFLPSTDQGGT